MCWGVPYQSIRLLARDDNYNKTQKLFCTGNHNCFMLIGICGFCRWMLYIFQGSESLWSTTMHGWKSCGWFQHSFVQQLKIRKLSSPLFTFIKYSIYEYSDRQCINKKSGRRSSQSWCSDYTERSDSPSSMVDASSAKRRGRKPKRYQVRAKFPVV